MVFFLEIKENKIIFMCGIADYLLDKIPQNIELIFDWIAHRGPYDKVVFKVKFIMLVLAYNIASYQYMSRFYSYRWT